MCCRSACQSLCNCTNWYKKWIYLFIFRSGVIGSQWEFLHNASMSPCSSLFRLPTFYLKDVVSLICLGDVISQKLSVPLVLAIFIPPLQQYSLNLECTTCIVYGSNKFGTTQSLFSELQPVVGFFLYWFSSFAKRIFLRGICVCMCIHLCVCLYTHNL